MSRMTRTKASPVLTVVVSVVVVIAVVIFLISTTATLQTTAATSSKDTGLMFLRTFGAFPKVTVLLMLFFAALAFKYAIGESRKELKEDDSQVVRFVIIGCAFIVVAIIIFFFSFGFPMVIF